jgi:hypothetical protein
MPIRGCGELEAAGTTHEKRLLLLMRREANLCHQYRRFCLK